MFISLTWNKSKELLLQVFVSHEIYCFNFAVFLSALSLHAFEIITPNQMVFYIHYFANNQLRLLFSLLYLLDSANCLKSGRLLFCEGWGLGVYSRGALFVKKSVSDLGFLLLSKSFVLCETKVSMSSSSGLVGTLPHLTKISILEREYVSAMVETRTGTFLH